MIPFYESKQLLSKNTIMKMKQLRVRPLLFVIILLALSSCARTVAIELPQEIELYGFWNGLWHGLISPITLIISFFKENITMYAINNNGGWYNTGFLFGASLIFGGGCKAGNRKKSRC